jgi:hypothetical protein
MCVQQHAHIHEWLCKHTCSQHSAGLVGGGVTLALVWPQLVTSVCPVCECCAQVAILLALWLITVKLQALLCTIDCC